MGGFCAEIDHYPNATISEYGAVSGADNMAAEIMARGPIACGVDANPLLNYTGGIISTAGAGVDHIVSVIGWGTEAGSKGPCSDGLGDGACARATLVPTSHPLSRRMAHALGRLFARSCPTMTDPPQATTGSCGTAGASFGVRWGTPGLQRARTRCCWSRTVPGRYA